MPWQRIARIHVFKLILKHDMQICLSVLEKLESFPQKIMMGFLKVALPFKMVVV